MEIHTLSRTQRKDGWNTVVNCKTINEFKQNTIWVYFILQLDSFNFSMKNEHFLPS